MENVDPKASTLELTGKYYASIGRRKTSQAQVRLYFEAEQGLKGKIVVNGRDYKEFFPTFDLQRTVELPLKTTGFENDFYISVVVSGGGIRGQADSVKLGISRALLKMNPLLKPTLKPLDLLTRDPRKKERKKPGLKRARRAPQWQKR